ncbi:MAG: hypothetical protein HY350_00655 [Candidatus Omnitrophica bacterium]|nr:hypothetical protein [Candidatus Omnitrophota bacterium]
MALFKKRSRYFICPVCHFQMSWNDRDINNMVVCPVCGAVLQLAESSGAILAVVSDMEIERYQPRFRIHPISVTLPLAFFSTALLLSIISLIFNNPEMDRSGIILLAIGTFTAPIAFASGLFDWLKKYKGRPYFITRQKIGISIALLALSIICLIWRAFTPQLLTVESPLKWLYLLLLAILFALGVSLGHLGGRLVYGK